MKNNKQSILNPLSDIVFKALFGTGEKNSRIILIDLLNTILGLKNEEKILTIEHMNPFNLQEYEGDKSSILDIKIKNQKGERINNEVQINKADDFRKRSLYYWAKMYAETINEAQRYTTLKKSIVINIMDFDIIEETKRYHTEYKIFEKEEKFQLIDDLEIHYIELKKFKTDKAPKNMEDIELWLNFIKKAGKEDIKELIKRKEELKIAMERLEKISADEILREKYAAQEKARLDAISSMKFVEERGINRGRAEGRAEGEAKGLAKGRTEGRAEGKSEVLIRLLTKKLGILPVPLQDKIRNASSSVQEQLTEDIFEISSIEEVINLIDN